MFEGIPINSELTPAYLLGLAVLLLLFGFIVPRRTLTDKIKECEKWQTAYEKERESRIESVSQVRELLEVTKTSYSVLTALFENSEKLRRSGESDAPTQE